jgi:hypothetical protein
MDGINFGPDGTLYAKGPFDEILSISGTNSMTPGTVTLLINGPGPYDGVAVAVRSTVPPTALFLFANRNDGVITKIDLTQNPVVTSTVASGGSRGDLAAVGPDGCFYATQSDRVLRVTNADGSCPFSPTSAASGLVLTPAQVDPPVGTPFTFTATFNNLAVPANTPVIFNVLGPNFQSSLARTNANGQATFTYAGVFTGTDTVVATATVGGNTLMSNIAHIIWTAGPHTTSCDLDLSPKTGGLGGSRNLNGLLFDISQIPPVPVTGASLTLAVGSQSCSSTTNGSGQGSCSLVLNTPGVLPLTGTFAGSSQLLATKCTSSFSTLSNSQSPPPPPPASIPALSIPGMVTFGVLLAALGVMIQSRRMA